MNPSFLPAATAQYTSRFSPEKGKGKQLPISDQTPGVSTPRFDYAGNFLQPVVGSSNGQVQHLNDFIPAGMKLTNTNGGEPTFQALLQAKSKPTIPLSNQLISPVSDSEEVFKALTNQLRSGSLGLGDLGIFRYK